MAEESFDNVHVVARANVYYDGAVTSREIHTAEGERKTLGIMRPGEYAFETEDEETIEIYAGALTVVVDGQRSRYASGDTFTVTPDTEFTVEVAELVDYCCTYG